VFGDRRNNQNPTHPKRRGRATRVEPALINWSIDLADKPALLAVNDISRAAGDNDHCFGDRTPGKQPRNHRGVALQNLPLMPFCCRRRIPTQTLPERRAGSGKRESRRPVRWETRKNADHQHFKRPRFDCPKVHQRKNSPETKALDCILGSRYSARNAQQPTTKTAPR
jgi:hypothetical protein